MNNLIDRYDFDDIGLIAKHCNNEKLRISIREAQEFDLKRLLCGFYSDVCSNWKSDNILWQKLILGGAYNNCKNQSISFGGLKLALIYFSYSRYIVLNNFDDTPNGGVTKSDSFSIPKPLKELHQFSNKYSSMAKQVFDETMLFLCTEQDSILFDNYDFCNCSNNCDCGCGCDTNPNKRNRGHGLKSNNISKY